VCSTIQAATMPGCASCLISALVLALPIGNSNAGRIAVESHTFDSSDDSPEMSQCVLKGPEGSGFEYRRLAKSGRCTTTCKGSLYIVHNELMPKVMSVEESPEDNKCTCHLEGSQGVFLRHLHASYDPCTQQKCWDSYLRLYNAGKEDSLHMGSGITNSLTATCAPCDDRDTCNGRVTIKSLHVSDKDFQILTRQAEDGDQKAKQQLEIMKEVEMVQDGGEDVEISETFEEDEETFAEDDGTLSTPPPPGGQPMNREPAESEHAGFNDVQGDELEPEKLETTSTTTTMIVRSYLMHLYHGNQCVRASGRQVGFVKGGCSVFKFVEQEKLANSLGGHFTISGMCLSYNLHKQLMSYNFPDCEDCLELSECGLKGYSTSPQDWFALDNGGVEHCVSSPNSWAKTGNGSCLRFEGRQEVIAPL